jgi:hypothetical protein
MVDLNVRLRAVVEDNARAITAEEIINRGGEYADVATRGRRSKRRVLLNATAALLAAAAIAVGVVVASDTGRSPTAKVQVRDTAPTTTTLPAVLSGSEQLLTQVSMPSELSSELANFASEPGTEPHAFVVDNSPVIVVARVASGTCTDCNYRFPGVLVLQQGAPGGLPLGVSETYRSNYELTQPSSPLGVPSLLNPWDWPIPRQRWIWLRVPKDAAYVTVTYGSDVRLWQRPVDGVAAFQFPIPENQMNAPASPDDPVAHMKAYSADGQLVGSVDGSPR